VFVCNCELVHSYVILLIYMNMDNVDLDNVEPRVIKLHRGDYPVVVIVRGTRGRVEVVIRNLRNCGRNSKLEKSVSNTFIWNNGGDHVAKGGAHIRDRDTWGIAGLE